jgi:hypothetical protein
MCFGDNLSSTSTSLFREAGHVCAEVFPSTVPCCDAPPPTDQEGERERESEGGVSPLDCRVLYNVVHLNNS